jgi:hypothetical protein
LRDRRKRAQPVRLSNEQEDVLLRLVRENPEWGARRLGEALSQTLSQDIKRARVLASLKRRKLNSRAARRQLAGLPPVEPKSARPARKRIRRRAAPPALDPSEAVLAETAIPAESIADVTVADEAVAGDAGEAVAGDVAGQGATAEESTAAVTWPGWVSGPEGDDKQDQIETEDEELDRTGS